MRAHIRHRTRLTYEEEVVESVMDTRFGPWSDPHQTWNAFELRVQPSASIRRYVDGFGNTAHLVTIAKAHRSIDLIAEGTVTTLLANPITDVSAPEPLSALERSDYLGASALVPAVNAIAVLAQPFKPATDALAFDAVTGLNREIHQRFEYLPGITGTESTVPDVLVAGAGVCQDFAHVLIALCRSIGLPARYVSGYVVELTDRLQRGSGASHAWAEVWIPTHGWRGFDPTHDLIAGEHHVKIAVGRDYRDVAPTRGTFRGSARETLAVEVSVKPA